MKHPKLEDVMTPMPFVVRPEDTIALAQRIMNLRRIRHLPVVRDDELVGLLSQRNVQLHGNQARVADAMVTHPYAVDVATPLDDVVTTMAARKLGSAVVTHQGRVVGVFTTVDALRMLAGLLTCEDQAGISQRK